MKNFIFYNLFYTLRLVVPLIILIILGCIYNYKTLIIISIIGLLFLMFFFRNNLTLEKLEKNNNLFLSPSSSKVMKVYATNRFNVIYTYLSLYDKHFMIAPTDCVVKDIVDLNTPNDVERKRIIFLDKYNNEFYLDQIVTKYGFGGYLYKFFYKNRCVVFCKKGDKLKQGDRYGLIRFGSNMEYFLPKSYQILVNKNEKKEIGNVICKVN